MYTYKITSKGGVEYGLYFGDSKTDALCSLHIDAGYDVTYDRDADSLCFVSASDAELCGDVDSWIITELNEGTVEHEGKTLWLLQQPFVTNSPKRYDGDEGTYEADAMDADGERYRVLWDITNTETADESECCDWDDYRIVR